MYERLPCGIIFTGEFREWLAAWREREANFGLIPELSYVRCKEGDRAGQAWVSLLWRPLDAVQEHEVFAIGAVRLFFSRQTRAALRERCLDIKDGQIVVL